MKILVIGSKGQLGMCLYEQLRGSYHQIKFSSKEQIDISNFELTKKKIFDFLPEVIINLAAYTSVDQAEKEPDKAFLNNHHAVKNIARVCNITNSWLIHLSTDYVFDGLSKKPYKEDDHTNPKSTYGLSKLKGEMSIAASGCKHIIIRTSWVYSEYGNNFLKTMLNLGQKNDELSIICDQVGCPTYGQDIANAIIKIISKIKTLEKSGIYHFSGNKSCSWFEFAKLIFYFANINNIKSPNSLRKINTDEYQALAERPAFSVLDCTKIQDDFGIALSNCEDGIIKSINRLIKKEF